MSAQRTLSERLLQCWLRSSTTCFRTRLPDQDCDHQASCPPPNFGGEASSRTPAVALILSRVVRFSCSSNSSASCIARIRLSDVHALLLLLLVPRLLPLMICLLHFHFFLGVLHSFILRRGSCVCSLWLCSSSSWSTCVLTRVVVWVVVWVVVLSILKKERFFF